MLLEDSSLWHLKVKFMPTRPLQKHCIQWRNRRRCKLVHEWAMYAKFHSMAGSTFDSSCRSGRSFQKAECTVEDRQQLETAAVSQLSRASSSLFFRRSSLLSSILGWKHESHDCWLPISSHCFHAFMLSTHCTLDSSEPRMRCSFLYPEAVPTPDPRWFKCSGPPHWPSSLVQDRPYYQPH